MNIIHNFYQKTIEHIGIKTKQKKLSVATLNKHEDINSLC